jgi:hypothetical protein
LFVLFTVLVGALQTLPAYEYGTRSIRWVGSQNAVFWGQYVPYSVHQQPVHSLFPLGVLGLVLPNLSPHDTFVGLAVLTLGLVGLAACFEAVEVRLLGAIGAGGLLLALGGFSVFHGLAYLVVPMRRIRPMAGARAAGGRYSALARFGGSCIGAHGSVARV